MSNKLSSSGAVSSCGAQPLKCQNLSFHYANQKIFSNLSFNLNAQSSLSVMGINGSGKTTLLKILGGILKPTDGYVFCFDEQIWPRKNMTFEHKSIYLSDNPSFYLDQSVRANLNFYLKCYDLPVQNEKIKDTLQTVDLLTKEHQTLRFLSNGQKRRLTLAIIFLLKPKIVFADEPTNGLDAKGVNLCLELFDDLMQREKTSFIIATHDSELIQWSTHTISLQDFKSSQILFKLKNKIRTLL